MLDQSTLLLVQVCITALTTLLLITEAVSSDALKEQRLWAFGNLCACAGLSIGAMTFLPDLIHGSLSYGLMGLGQAIVLRGLRIFGGRDLSQRWVVAITVLAVLLPGYFVLIQPSLNGRLVVTGLYFGVINLISALTLLREVKNSQRPSLWVGVIGFSAFGAALLLRGLVVLFDPQSSSEDQNANQIVGVTLFVIAMAQVTITSGMLMMVSNRFAERLSRLTLLDGLTGAYNRIGLERLGTRMLARARRERRNISLAMIDADHFKAINDTYGHPVGDEVLRHLAGLLSAQSRPNDMVVRYGGEEFLLILDGITSKAALAIVERLRQEIEQSHINIDAKRITYTVSIGVTCTDTCGYDLKKLIAVADGALYQAKQSGRNKVCGGQNDLPTSV